MNKYLAFVSFGHNGVNVKSGEIFEAKDKKFKTRDIDFLLSQNKIMLVDKVEKTKINMPISVDIVERRNEVDAEAPGIIDLSTPEQTENIEHTKIENTNAVKANKRGNKKNKIVAE